MTLPKHSDDGPGNEGQDGTVAVEGQDEAVVRPRFVERVALINVSGKVSGHYDSEDDALDAWTADSAYLQTVKVLNEDDGEDN